MTEMRTEYGLDVVDEVEAASGDVNSSLQWGGGVFVLLRSFRKYKYGGSEAGAFYRLRKYGADDEIEAQISIRECDLKTVGEMLQREADSVKWLTYPF